MCDTFTHGGSDVSQQRTYAYTFSLEKLYLRHPTLFSLYCRRSKWSTTTSVCEQTSFNKRNGYIKVISFNLPAASLMPRHWTGAAIHHRQSANEEIFSAQLSAVILALIFLFIPFIVF